MQIFSIPNTLDEILILHSWIAERLLSDFPDAYGVSFTLSPERSYAMARMDVPEGYADGYREPGLEELAKELLHEISPRMSELHEALSSIISKTDSIFISAVRNTEKNGLQKVGGIELRGSLVGGIGAQSIRRQIVATEGRIISLSPARFELTAIIEDPEVATTIERAVKDGFSAAWDALRDGKLFLNSSTAKKTEFSRLRKWLSHFPNPNEAVRFHLENQVCRISTSSKDRRTFLAVKTDDELASNNRRKQINDTGMEVLVFDPVRGFGLEEPFTIKPR